MRAPFLLSRQEGKVKEVDRVFKSQSNCGHLSDLSNNYLMITAMVMVHKVVWIFERLMSLTRAVHSAKIQCPCFVVLPY